MFLMRDGKESIREGRERQRDRLFMHRRSPKLHTKSNEKNGTEKLNKKVEVEDRKSRSFVICVEIHFALELSKIGRTELARCFVSKSHRAADKRKGKRKPKEFS